MPAEHEPGRFDSPHFRSVAGTRFADVEWHDEIGSTNTELLERARRGAPEGMVLIADLQTAGRGRRGRRWTAPPGTSLMMSVLLRPPPGPLPPSRAALVTLAVGLAAADACEQVSGVRPRLKWPNDLVIADGAGGGPAGGNEPGRDGAGGSAAGHDRKLAGILAESISTQGLLSAVVVGMGLNTGWPEVPAELEGVATSLNLESGAPVDRTLLARRVLEGVEARYELLCRAADGTGAAIMLDEARRNSATLGHRVRVSLDAAPRARAARERSEQERETDRGATRRPASSLNPVAAPANGARSLEGVASDLDAAGRLLITDDAGAVHSVSVGDVVHLRPA